MDFIARRNYTGENNPFYGQHHSGETKNKIREKWIKKYNEGYINPRKGINLSVETRQKLSETRKKMFERGEITHHMKGKHWSDEIKKKQSKAKKGMYLGKNNPFYGKKHTEASRKRMGVKEGSIPWNKDKTDIYSDETLKRMQKAKENYIPWNKGKPGMKLQDNPAWRGGISFEPYGLEFNDEIKKQVRQRDDNVCVLCGKKDYRDLSIHHIDYNKQNNHPNNLISLCNKHHIWTNTNRIMWYNYFIEGIIDYEFNI